MAYAQFGGGCFSNGGCGGFGSISGQATFNAAAAAERKSTDKEEKHRCRNSSGGFEILVEKEHVPNDKDFVIPGKEIQATDNEVFTSSDPNFWDYVRLEESLRVTVKNQRDRHSSGRLESS